MIAKRTMVNLCQTTELDRPVPKKWFVPVAVFMSADGGEYCVSPPYAGRYRVFGPWTCDTVASFKREAEAVEHARELATDPFTGAKPTQEWPPPMETPR